MLSSAFPHGSTQYTWQISTDLFPDPCCCIEQDREGGQPSRLATLLYLVAKKVAK